MDIDKFNWDFERVEAWAEEEELAAVAEPKLAVLANKGEAVITDPSHPFDRKVETCGSSDKKDDLKYESQAFFYS